MADDDEVVIHIDDEALAETLGLPAEKKSDAEVKAKDVPKREEKKDDPVESLKSQFSTLQERTKTIERERNEALQREADANARAEKVRSDAQMVVASSQYDTVLQGLAAVEAEQKAARAKYKTAFETGDADAMATAQEEIATAAARRTQLEGAKVDLESEARRAKDAPPPREVPRAQPRDKFEAYLEGRTEPTKDWLRKHPDWVTDQKKNSKLTAAHFDAVGEGLAPDSQEYFDHVETFIGIKADTAAKPEPKPEPRQQRRPSAPTTPVVHSGGGTNSSGSNEVRLSLKERESATDGTLTWNYDDPSPQKRFKKGDPIGIQEFARRKLQMQRDGRYDKSMTE